MAFGSLENDGDKVIWSGRTRDEVTPHNRKNVKSVVVLVAYSRSFPVSRFLFLNTLDAMLDAVLQ